MTQGLDFLLPEGQVDTVCGLSWNHEMLVDVDVDVDRIRRSGLHFDPHISIDLIGDRGENKVFILPRGRKKSKRTLNINQSRYVLIGGIAGVSDTNDNSLFYRAFSVEERKSFVMTWITVSLLRRGNVVLKGCFCRQLNMVCQNLSKRLMAEDSIYIMNS